MARLTESYLRNMIKQVMKEEYDQYAQAAISDFEDEAYGIGEEEVKTSENMLDDAMRLADTIRMLISDADGGRSVTVPVIDLQDMSETAEMIYKHLAGDAGTIFDKSRSMSRTAVKTGMPHKYSAGPHMSPTMDENRRRRTATKRK